MEGKKDVWNFILQQLSNYDVEYVNIYIFVQAFSSHGESATPIHYFS
jgi:hypothetical protein